MEKKEETKKFDGGYGLCPRCQESSLIWGGDFTFEDYGMDGEGLVSNYICPVCGSYIEVFTSYPEEPKKYICYDNKTNYGELGEPTEFTDEFGDKLYIGDVVIIVDSRNEYRAYSVVVKSNNYPNGFIMGIADNCNQETKTINRNEWKTVKLLDWSLVEETPNINNIYEDRNLKIIKENK